jgi:hypothetical protein
MGMKGKPKGKAQRRREENVRRSFEAKREGADLGQGSYRYPRRARLDEIEGVPTLDLPDEPPPGWAQP